MNSLATKVFLNRFPVKRLTQAEQTVQVYIYKFTSSPEPGKEYSAINNFTYHYLQLSELLKGKSLPMQK